MWDNAKILPFTMKNVLKSFCYKTFVYIALVALADKFIYEFVCLLHLHQVVDWFEMDKHQVEKIFSGAFPEEFDKEGLVEIFEILQNQQRDDLMEKLKSVLEYVKLNVRYFTHFLVFSRPRNYFTFLEPWGQQNWITTSFWRCYKRKQFLFH